MNCKHVEELLPLYVGRDLEEKRMKLVTAHVERCAECAAAADEFRRTQQLLHLFAPPPFSQAVYSGVRQRVLREIGQESPESIAPTLPQLAASLFRPRFAWAIATALLLAVSVFAFYFIANRTNDRQQLANKPGAEDQSTGGEQANARSGARGLNPLTTPSSKTNTEPPLSSTSRKTPAGPTIAGSGNSTHQSQRRKGPRVAANPASSVAVNEPHPTESLTANASPLDNNLAEPGPGSTRDPATSGKTLRVEMQTKDSNIRIIWFSRHHNKQDSPSESSKGI